MIGRNIEGFGLEVLNKYNKMFFVSGPRQSGKTTFARALLENHFQGIYTNWDDYNDQKTILKDPYFFEKESRDLKKSFLIIFDEIHKYKNWKNYLKGCFDSYNLEFKFIVTGSGRLDLFKKGGDSLFGRYFPIHLFPFSLGELENNKIDWNSFYEALLNGFDKRSSYENYLQLFQFTGFPEPLLKNEKVFYNLWSRERKKTLIKEDIRDVYAIKEISNIEILSNLLPYKISSPLSINSIREDISVAFDSVKKWLSILEQFYYFFAVKTYSKSLSRAIKKEPKIYLYDWGEIEDESRRFENLIAFHLYKAVNLWSEIGLGQFDLFYLRDKDGREVDFLIVKDGKGLFMVEAKYSDEEYSKNLLYYQTKMKIPFAIQVVHKKDVLKRTKINNHVQYIISADNFIRYLP